MHNQMKLKHLRYFLEEELKGEYYLCRQEQLEIHLRRLLIHPVAVACLNEFSGKGFRLDHGPLLIGAVQGTEGHTLHGAGEPFSPSVWYHQQNGRIYCRGITVAWQLAACKAGDGGFAIVPGSHKRRKKPKWVNEAMEDEISLEAPAGSLAIWRSWTRWRESADSLPPVRTEESRSSSASPAS